MSAVPAYPGRHTELLVHQYMGVGRASRLSSGWFVFSNSEFGSTCSPHHHVSLLCEIKCELSFLFIPQAFESALPDLLLFPSPVGVFAEKEQAAVYVLTDKQELFEKMDTS
jgi:hypothetical protein